MRANNRWIWSVLAILFCLLQTAQALPVQDDCDESAVSKIRPESLLHPDLFFESQQPLMQDNRWADVARNIVESAEQATAISHDPAYPRFMGQLRALRTELENVTAGPDFRERMSTARGVKLNRFQIHMDSSEDKVSLFYRTSEEIDINDRTDPAVRREYCWRAIAVNRILSQYSSSARDNAAAALRSYVSQWDAYNANGYLQYPWELFANGAWTYDKDTLAPPRYQLVLLHPGVGIEQSGQSFDKSRLSEVVTVEPIGFLWYTQSRNSYYGASALLSLSGDRDPGGGVLLHFGKFAKLGFVWRHNDDQGRSQNGVVFSMDLYQMLSDAPQGQVDKREQAKRLYETYISKGPAAGN